MFKNYLKTTLRNLLRYKSYSLINIIGLSVGMACCLLILLYVMHEFSYDRFHSNSDNIYRVVSEAHLGGNEYHWADSPMPLAASIEEAIPEIHEAVLLDQAGGKNLVLVREQQYYEENIYYAEPEIFEVFDFPLIEGDPESALDAPYSVVITSKMAAKYFNSDTAIGETLTINTGGAEKEFRVTGIMEEVPDNSHISFNLLISFDTIRNNPAKQPDNWNALGSLIYVLLEEDAKVTSVNEKMMKVLQQKTDSEDLWYSPYLQPLTDIHLNRSGLGIAGQSDVRYIYIFTLVALLVLVIACINYMNLATVRGTKRGKEVGIRKVLGAGPSRIMLQFFVEAVAFSLFSMVFALLLAELMMPFFNELTNKEIQISLFQSKSVWLLLLGTALCTSLISGGYPAFVLSRFHPVSIFKNQDKEMLSGQRLRKWLVVVQFTATFVLIVCTIVIFQQLNYIQNKNLGYDKEHVMVIPLHTEETNSQYKLIRESFKTLPNVLSVAASSGSPVSGLGSNGILYNGETDAVMTHVLSADYKYQEALGLSLAEGRWFSPEYGTDPASGFIVNQALVNERGWKSPLGQKLRRNNQKGEVIGVVEDFHYASLHTPIEPLVIHLGEDNFEMLNVRLSGEQLSETIGALQSIWAGILPSTPFEYTFLDDSYRTIYESEIQLSKLFFVFSGLAILIACLGTLGLLAFTIELKKKELSIRKVFGATPGDLIRLLTNKTIILVFSAFVIGTPLAWILANRWLSEFSYHTELNAWIFLSGASITLGITAIIILYQTSKAAITNPVESLRSE